MMLFSWSHIECITIPSEVTRISTYTFYYCKQLQRIEFANDSKLQTIESLAFASSTIESITIPSQLVELKEGWCQNATNLTNVSVSGDNTHYMCVDGKIIFGKTNITKSLYDSIVFCARNIESIMIPDFVEHICSYAFNSCNKLQRIEFSAKSKLKTIEAQAFYESSIKNITIPQKVTRIGKYAFGFCKKLRRIEFADDSKLQTIEEKAFCCSSINCITIPREVTHIGDSAFYLCEKLRQIEFAEYSQLQTIEEKAFSGSSITGIIIPCKVTQIRSEEHTSELQSSLHI